jgi:alpha-D-ribose 1-methylphosphonate 5-triphosphate diphosphatase PhnM
VTDGRLFLTGGRIVTGDERTVIEGGTLVLRDGRIEGVEERWSGEAAPDVETVDVSGCVVLPGLINGHTHGVAPGPLFPSAEPAPTEVEWRASLDRHLLAGTTTVLSLCGFVPMESIAEADRNHPVNVKGSTAHTPSALLAARAADGTGLASAGPQPTVESMLAAGAVAIGEMGAGTTLGGGGQDVIHIPRAVELATGIAIEPHRARAIKEAALGREIRPGRYDQDAMEAALAGAGLSSLLAPDDARRLVETCVLPSVGPARQSFREGAELAAQHGVPVLFHTAAASADEMRAVAAEFAGRVRLVACHCNHTSFTSDEALDLTVELAGHGCAVELSTVDLLGGKRVVRTRANWDRLLGTPELVDVLATDYGFHGIHDPLIGAVADVVEHGFASLPVAIAMASSRVAALIPGIAPERGELAAGRIADVAVVRDDFRSVRHVFAAGRHVVRDGSLAVNVP